VSRNEQTIHAYIAGHHRVLLEGLAIALSQGKDIQATYVPSVPSAHSVLKDVAIRPGVDVAIFDGLHQQSWEEVSALVRLGLPVIVLADDSVQTDDVRSIVHAGASGIILASTSLSELVLTIRAVRGGQLSLPLQRRAALFDYPPSKPRLSPREMQVLELLVKGATTDRIADQLGISSNTVRSMLHRMRTKRGVQSTVELVADAIRHGLVERRQP
jgi:DNA-binding NarL/FixJ family response regulator